MPLLVDAMVNDEWPQDLDEIRLGEMGESVVRELMMMARVMSVIVLLLELVRRHCRRLELRSEWRIVGRSKVGWMDSRVRLPRVLPLC